MSEAPWTVVFAAEAINDLLLISEYLAQAYCSFGESPAEADRHAQARIEAIIAAAERLATAPWRGESHDDLMPGLRHLQVGPELGSGGLRLRFRGQAPPLFVGWFW